MLPTRQEMASPIVGPAGVLPNNLRGKAAEVIMSLLTPWDADAFSPSKVSFKVQRAFKALDDGKYRKWVLVVRLQDLPANLPLDANARLPNVTTNKTCADMRATLLSQPELFQIFNGGVVCVANGLNVRQIENSTYVDMEFDPDGGQGIVNGGHSYATSLLIAHSSTSYSAGKDLVTVLAEDLRSPSQEVKEQDMKLLVSQPTLLAERVSRAKQTACLQIEVVAPIPDAELLARVAKARNISLPVQNTSLANLGGRYDHLKAILRQAFGEVFINRIIWRSNQPIPEDSRKIDVKLLHYAIALLDIRTYKPGFKYANEVYSKPGLVIREYIEADGEAERALRNIESSLPGILELYDYIYAAIAEADPAYPWQTGNLADGVRHHGTFTPFFSIPCPVKVDRAFHWPVFSAFRQLLVAGQKDAALHWLTDPFSLFDEIKTEIVEKLKSFHQNQAKGLLRQVGRDRELWQSMDSIVEREIILRRRSAVLGDPLPIKPRTAPNAVQDEVESPIQVEEAEVKGRNPYAFKRPISLSFRGERVETSTWKDAHIAAAVFMARTYPTQFATRLLSLNGAGLHPYAASRLDEMFFIPRAVPGTTMYLETNFSGEQTAERIRRLFRAFGHADGEWSLEMVDSRRNK